MQEKLAKKLAKILAKAGLDEDEIGKFVEEIDEAIAEEDPKQDEVNPDENPNPTEENGGQTPTEEGAGDNPNPEGDLPIPPTPEGDVPPEGDPAQTTPEGDGSIDSALQELAAQEQQGEQLPPTPDQVPPQVPGFDPTVIAQFEGKLAEANKTIDALKVQVDSLLEALREAGVISKDAKVGEETPRVTPSSNADQEDVFDDILGVINGK